MDLITSLRVAGQSLRAAEAGSMPKSLAGKLDALAVAQQLRNQADAAVNDLLVDIAMDRDQDVLGTMTDDAEGLDSDGEDVACRLEKWSQAPELVAPVLGVSINVAKGRLRDAVGLAQRAPALVEEMRAGSLDGYRASMVHALLRDAPAAAEAAVVAALVARADRLGAWTEPVGPLTRRTRVALAGVAPDFVAEQAKEYRTLRGIHKQGMTETLDRWDWVVPVEDSRLVWAAVDEYAATLLAADPDLSAAQARSDALTALVLDKIDLTLHLHAAVPDRSGDGCHRKEAAQPAAEPGGTDSSGPGELADEQDEMVQVTGLGAPDATLLPTPWIRSAIARGIAVLDASLTCDPDTGALVGGDITKGFRPSTRRPGPCTSHDGATNAADIDPRYRIPEAIRRFVAFRDKTCRFPGCSISVRFTDLDHVRPWPTGPTSPENLMSLCRRHHRLKQTPGWSVILHADGTTTWTTPTGGQLHTDPVNLLATSDSVPRPEPPAALAGASPSPLEQQLTELLAAA